MAERIGDYLVGTGAMQQSQVDDVVAAQKAGDTRTFGEIAVSLGFVSRAAVDASSPPVPGKYIRASPQDERQFSPVTRSLYFTAEPEGALALATSMEHAILEVLAVPEDYTDVTALQITESVHKAGIIGRARRAGPVGAPSASPGPPWWRKESLPECSSRSTGERAGCPGLRAAAAHAWKSA